jgi:hypothetical protein
MYSKSILYVDNSRQTRVKKDVGGDVVWLVGWLVVLYSLRMMSRERIYDCWM